MRIGRGSSGAALRRTLLCAWGHGEHAQAAVLDLQADRLSTQHLASNQLRLWFATFGYLLMERLRALGWRDGVGASDRRECALRL